MKNKLHQLLIMSSKFTLYGLVLQFFFVVSLQATEVAAQKTKSVKEVNLSMQVESKPILDVFRIIEQKSAFKFFYENKYIDKSLRYNFNARSISVNDILLQISRGSNLKFKQINNTINVTIKDPGKKNHELEIEIIIQTRTINGKVISSDDNQGLPGVNVIEKGTNNGTVTNVQGEYSLEVSDGAILVYSSVGYTSQEVEVGNQTVIDLSMSQDVQQLQELVVVGYGTQTQREVTGAISKIKSKEISQNINADPITSLQGNVAGVQLTQQGGQPGGSIRVRVRGSSSLLSSGDPLVVIDGIPVITSSFGSNPNDGISGLAEINPNDIESMEVLKDGAAAAIYGSRAANGVILITTKKGKAGKSTLNVDYQEGVTTPTNRIDLLNGTDLMAVNRRAWQNTIYSGTGAENYFPIPRNVEGANGYDEDVAANTNVNWLDQVLRDGKFRSVNISGSTGTEKTSVFASLGYRGEEGIEIGRDFTRANGRLNVNHQSNDKLGIGMNISLSYVERVNPGGHFGTAQSSALPIFPIYRPDDPTKFFNGFNESENNIGTNPIFYRDNYNDLTETYRSISNVYFDYKPIEGLSLRSEWGIDYQNNKSDSRLSQALFPPNNNGSKVGGNGKTDTRRFSTIAWNLNNTINYNRTFSEKHGLDILLGSSILNQESEGQTFVFEGLTFPNLPIAATYERTSNSQAVFRFISWFSRINYDYDGKYFVQVSARRDGSSRFGPGRRFGDFAGGSVGWAFSEEEFFKNQISFINFAKLRASYGTVGNAELPSDFLWVSLANVNDSEIGYGGFNGVAYERIGNNDLSWETTKQFNLGFDLAMINNRVNVTFDVYNKLSENLLLESRLANSTGYLDRNFVFNVGSIRNTGVELSINTDNINKGDFRWTTGFNISRNRGITESLTPPVNADDNTIVSFTTGDVKLTEGGNFGTYFLPVWAGVDPTTGTELIYEVDQVYLAETGIARLTGGVLDAEELGGNINNHRMILEDKTSLPDFFGGFNNSFSYKGLSLDVLFYFQYGNYILDQGERSQSYPGEQQSLRANMKEGLDLPEGQFSQNNPLLYNSNISGVNTTRFLHDASFIRLRNVQLSYTIPQVLTSKIGVSNLRVYASGQNLLTFTKFDGWDPEVFNAGGDQQRANAGPGSIGYNLPQVKTVLLGVNIGF